MANHPSRSEAAAIKREAKALGYYVRQGSYGGTSDDRLGRWYFGHDDDEFFRPYGAGYSSQGTAWAAALEDARERGLSHFIAG